MMHRVNYAVKRIVNRTRCRRVSGNRMHVAEKFERLLDAYRHPDGRRWSGAELAKATDGVVHRSYVTNLRKGRIESPGYDKMRAIAKAMDFPAALWFKEDLADGSNAVPDADLVAALRDDLVRTITRESSRLSGRDKEMILGIVRQFSNAGGRSTRTSDDVEDLEEGTVGADV